MKYRADIDGLRAIAVTSVIIHHAGFALHGGFLGVDIFFVISGFLITGIILRDLEADRFTLRAFYHRRIRRLMPALVFVAICAVPFAWVLMPPDQFANFGRSLIALPIFATNILFWRESGYFEADAAEIPMIHTWSLAVEEQFYVFYPLALLLLWRKGRRFILPLMIVGVAAGLVLAEVGVRNWPSAAFYLLPFRIWELMSGALAALLVYYLGRSDDVYTGVRFVSQRWNGLLSLIGLATICASLILFLPTSGSPGYKVIPLVLGAVLILLFTTPGTLTYRLLSLRGMVWVGAISYSAYLWHQPLFAFVRIASFEPPPHWVMLALIGVTLGLAWFSWAFVEEPFRRRLPSPLVYGSVVSGFIGLVALGFVAHSSGGMATQRFAAPKAAWFETTSFSPKRAACHTRPSRLPHPSEACVYFGDAPATWAVLGDSHGVEIAYALGRRLEQNGESLVQLTASACPPAYSFESTLDGCSAWTNLAVDWLADDPDIDTVVLAYRHLVHLYPSIGSPPQQLGTPKIMDGQTDAEKRDLYWQSFTDTVTRLSEAGKQVIIMEPIPEISQHINKYIRLAPVQDDRLPTISRETYDLVLAWLEPHLRILPAQRLAPAEALCDAAMCYGADAQSSYYFDSNHPSLAGADKIVARLFTQDPP